MAAQLEADVVIVGAGIAGALVGSKLAEAGVKVLILEAGPPVDRSAAVKAFRDAVNKDPESAYPAVPYAPSPTTSDPHSYYVQVGQDLFSSTYERRVGGTTWHWLGTALRHLPADFELRTRYGVGVDWPLGYDALESWYSAAEQELGVAGDNSAQLGVVRSSSYPQPPIPPTYSDKQVAAAVAALGLRVESTPQARNSTLFDHRPPCCGNASCIPICPIGAKYDAEVHVHKAQSAGAQLVDQAVADFVEVDAQGRVTRIRVKRPDRSEQWASGRVFVLAAHAIETPKLLLLSRTERLPNGVANSSDQVGRNLMDHPSQLSLALTKAPLYPYRSPLATSGIEQLRDGAFRAQRGAFRVEIGNDGWSWLGQDAVGITPQLIQQGLRGQALIAALNDHVSRQFRLASLVEQLPDPENRVTLATQVDALGIPRPQLAYRVGEYTQAGLNAARELHQQVFTALEASDIQHVTQFQGAGHIIGTYRMGTDPKTAVVDPDSRTHDHPNLFLLGSGVFPSTGTANPTLTIAALALRAVDPIRRTLTA